MDHKERDPGVDARADAQRVAASGAGAADGAETPQEDQVPDPPVKLGLTVSSPDHDPFALSIGVETEYVSRATVYVHEDGREVELSEINDRQSHRIRGNAFVQLVGLTSRGRLVAAPPKLITPIPLTEKAVILSLSAMAFTLGLYAQSRIDHAQVNALSGLPMLIGKALALGSVVYAVAALPALSILIAGLGLDVLRRLPTTFLVVRPLRVLWMLLCVLAIVAFIVFLLLTREYEIHVQETVGPIALDVRDPFSPNDQRRERLAVGEQRVLANVAVERLVPFPARMRLVPRPGGYEIACTRIVETRSVAGDVDVELDEGRARPTTPGTFELATTQCSSETADVAVKLVAAQDASVVSTGTTKVATVQDLNVGVLEVVLPKDALPKQVPREAAPPASDVAPAQAPDSERAPLRIYAAWGNGWAGQGECRDGVCRIAAGFSETQREVDVCITADDSLRDETFVGCINATTPVWRLRFWHELDVEKEDSWRVILATQPLCAQPAIPNLTVTGSKHEAAWQGTVGCGAYVPWHAEFGEPGLREARASTVDGAELLDVFVTERPQAATARWNNGRRMALAGTPTRLVLVGAPLDCDERDAPEQCKHRTMSVEWNDGAISGLPRLARGTTVRTVRALLRDGTQPSCTLTANAKLELECR